MSQQTALLASQVSTVIKMTNRSVGKSRLRQMGELYVRTDRSVLAKDVMIVRNHARLAMVRHRATASCVHPGQACSMAIVSPLTLMEFVKGLAE